LEAQPGTPTYMIDWFAREQITRVPLMDAVEIIFFQSNRFIFFFFGWGVTRIVFPILKKASSMSVHVDDGGKVANNEI